MVVNLMIDRRFLLTGFCCTAASLPLSALAGDIKITSLEGKYTSRGKNPDGSSYVGTAEIRTEGNIVYIGWRIAGQKFSGHGRLNGNVLTINWGDTTPVVYAVLPNGVLQGTWSNGKATDVLTPAR